MAELLLLVLLVLGVAFYRLRRGGSTGTAQTIYGQQPTWRNQRPSRQPAPKQQQNEFHGRYTFGDTVAADLLDALAEAVREKKAAEITLEGRTITIPQDGQLTVEYEQEWKGEELEIKLKWRSEANG